MKNSAISLLFLGVLPLLLSAQPLRVEIFGGDDPFAQQPRRAAKLFELNTLDPISKSWGKAGARSLAELKQMYIARGDYTPSGKLQAADIDAMFGILLPEQFTAPSADVKLPPDEYQTLLKALGAKAYKTRENATQRLLAAGPQNDPKKWLAEATRHLDPEIKLRALEIRTAWRAASVSAPNIHFDGFSNGFRRLLKSDLDPDLKQRILERGLSLMDEKKGAPESLQRLLAPVITATVISGTPEQMQFVKDTFLTASDEHSSWCFIACAKASKSDNFGDVLLAALRSEKPMLIGRALESATPEVEGARAALDELAKEKRWSDIVNVLLAGKFNDEKIFNRMIKDLITFEEIEPKKEALQQISKISRHHNKVPAELLGHLMPLAKDPTSELRRPAINCLAGFRDADLLKPLFEIYLADPKKLKTPVAKAFRKFPKEAAAIIAAAPDTAEAKDAIRKLKRTMGTGGDLDELLDAMPDPFGGGGDPFGQ